MAERLPSRALQDLENELTCPICLSLFQSPKILDCHHVFCQGCLPKLVQRTPEGNLTVPCSNCRQLTPVPSNGVAGLHTAFHINQLFEVRKNLLLGTSDAARPEPVIVETPEVIPERDKGCVQHPGEKLELFCQSCNRSICSHCVFRGESHHPHKYGMIKEVHTHYREDVVEALSSIKAKRGVVTDFISSFDSQISQWYDQQEEVKAAIQDHVKELHEIIDKLESDRIGQLYQIVQEKIDDVSPFRAQLETSQEQLDECIAMVMDKVETDDLVKLIKMKPALLLKINELSEGFQTESLLYDTSGNIKFTSGIERVSSVLKKSLKVYYSDVDASKCIVSWPGLREGFVGQENVAVIDSISSLCRPSRHPIEHIYSELISDMTDILNEVSITRKGGNQYELSYTPTVRGRHQLHVRVDGQHVPGSPYSFRVRAVGGGAKQKFRAPLKIIHNLVPVGIAVDFIGRIIVSDVNKRAISIFSQNGKCLTSVSGLVASPHGLTLDDKNNNVYVVDKVDNCIFKFNLSDIETATPICVAKKLDLKDPTDIAFNPKNNFLYITDTLNHRVLAHSTHSKSFNFGEKGSGKSGLLHPSGIACDSTGNIYVADLGNHRIQVFNSGGSFLRRFGKKGSTPGTLYYPCGVTVDYDNIVYVSDSNDRVSLFSCEGRFITSIGSEGHSSGLFNQPRMLAVDESGVLYVSDCSNSRLLMF